jgi:uncharacterized protein YidB (DUF937 family)
MEPTMVDVSKLTTLLDDPEIRVLVFGLAHVDLAGAQAEYGAPRLRELVLGLAETTRPDQYQRWLANGLSNSAMTADEVRVAIGDDAIRDLAQFAGSSPVDITSQVAAILPELVDAVSPDGQVLDADELGQQLREAVQVADEEAGPFGSRAH